MNRRSAAPLFLAALVAPGRTSAQAARAPTPEAHPGDYRPEAYGAIRDGAHHPLSERYGTLAAARAVYPKAAALTQSIDGAAIQKAIDAANAANGGTVRLGAGTYVCDGWTLVIPESKESSTTGVNIAGQGTASTRLRWAADMGTGKYAISCGDPAAHGSNRFGRYGGVGARYEGYCADFSLVGPAAPSPTRGAAPAAMMSGFAWGDRRQMVRVASRHWWAAIDVVGGQADWQHCWGVQSHYGLYYNTVSGSNWGDMAMTKCWFGDCGLAAVGVKNNGVIVSTDFRTCYFGTSPFCFYKEAGSQGWIDGFLKNCAFAGCQFEGYGNSCFRDANGSVAANTDSGYAAGLHFTHFYDPFFTKNAAYASASHPSKAVFDIHGFDRCEIRNLREPRQLLAMNESVFRLTSVNGLMLTGVGWEAFFKAPGNANKWFSGSGPDNSAALATITWEDALGSAGVVVRADAGAAVRAEQMLEYAGPRVAPASSDARMPAGVALVASGADRPAIVVTRSNSIPVALEGGVGLPVGALVKKGLAGGTASAAGPADGWVVGVVRGTGSATRHSIRIKG